MYKIGEWVHTQDGIGQVTLSFPCYYQFWEAISDEHYRKSTYGDNDALADSILGARKSVGECYKYILYIKRLCDHDGVPCKRIMGFHAMAYENDRADTSDQIKIEAASMDVALMRRFNQFEVKYPSPVRKWGVSVPNEILEDVVASIHCLDADLVSGKEISVLSLYDILKERLEVDMTASLVGKIIPNLHIYTYHHPENSELYYNENREEMICRVKAEILSV